MATKKKPKWGAGIDEKRGRFRYRFQIPGRPRVTVDTGLEAVRRNLEAVKRRRDEHKARLLLGEPEPLTPILFSDAADRFEAFKRALHRDKPNTWKRISGSLASWRVFLGRKLMQDLTVGDVRDYTAWRLQQGVADVTLRKDLLAGRQLARFAAEHRWLDADPFLGVAIPSDSSSRNEVVLTAEETVRYLRVADNHPALGDLARLILNQGLRPDCEVLQIRRADVDFEARTLRIPQSKSKAGRRTLNLTDESLRILARRLEATETDWAFPGQEHVGGPRYRDLPDRPLSYSGLVSAHGRVLQKVDVIPFVLYSLRHTFATWFYDRTRDLIALKDVLGHADLRTVLRYVNENQERMRIAMARFEEAGNADIIGREIVQ